MYDTITPLVSEVFDSIKFTIRSEVKALRNSNSKYRGRIESCKFYRLLLLCRWVNELLLMSSSLRLGEANDLGTLFVDDRCFFIHNNPSLITFDSIIPLS